MKHHLCGAPASNLGFRAIGKSAIIRADVIRQAQTRAFYTSRAAPRTEIAMSTEISEAEFPEKGILWRGWNDETLRRIQEKQWPVLLFVADPDPVVRPFLREIFKAMPANSRLRDLLHDFFVPLLIEAESLPEDLKAFGAGSKYHIAVLSPHGLTPLVTIGVHRRPDDVVTTVVETLERLVHIWR